MNFVNKINFVQNGNKIKKVYIAGILCFDEKKSIFSRHLRILGIHILSRKFKLYKKMHICDNLDEFIGFYNKQFITNNQRNILWLDHSYGGGTEAYSYNKFLELSSEFNFIRIQYYPAFDTYVVSIPDIAVVNLYNLDEIKNFIYKLNLFEICVNSLVGWKVPLDLLKMVSHYKKDHLKTKISFRGHDFYAICPSYNLLNCDKVFCNLSYSKGCSYCLKKIALDNIFLVNGDIDVDIWKTSWNDFFSNTLDEMIVFSCSTKELFIRSYPVLEKKIIIISHNTVQLPKVRIDKHKNINVAFLGNMTAFAKGGEVVRKMCDYNADPHIKFFVIGTYKNPPKNLVVTGKYNTNELPNLIQKYRIDIVFISSVCPETFSYTTSEAINMNIPVVCYNFGAPVERVSMYKYGLVLTEINPKNNLLEIKNFIEELRMHQ